MISLNVNGKAHNLDIDSETPLLWVIRDELGLTGTKYGCGKSLCGACTVLIDGRGGALPVSLSVSAGRQKTITDDRGPVFRPWPPAAKGLDSRRRAAVRLLPVRTDYAGCGAAQEEPKAD